MSASVRRVGAADPLDPYHPGVMSAARHLLLDFGAVVSVSLFEDLASIERAFALPAGTLDWTGPLAGGTDPLWRAMQAGELSERDYWRRRAAELGARVGRDLDVVTMVRAAREHDPDGCVRPRARTLIDAARAAGRRVGLLSNELVLSSAPAAKAGAARTGEAPPKATTWLGRAGRRATSFQRSSVA